MLIDYKTARDLAELAIAMIDAQKRYLETRDKRDWFKVKELEGILYIKSKEFLSTLSK